MGKKWLKTKGMVMISWKQGAEILLFWGLWPNAVAGEQTPAIVVPMAFYDPVQPCQPRGRA